MTCQICHTRELRDNCRCCSACMGLTHDPAAGQVPVVVDPGARICPVHELPYTGIRGCPACRSESSRRTQRSVRKRMRERRNTLWMV